MAGRGKSMTLPAWMSSTGGDGSVPGASREGERSGGRSDSSRYEDAPSHRGMHRDDDWRRPAADAAARRTEPSTAPSGSLDIKALIAAATARATSTATTSSASKPARKLYVGGLPLPEASEATLTTFFNQVLDLCYKPSHDHVMSVYINVEKRFAFIELRSVELATAVMTLDGILFMGQPLKIKRPNDYSPLMAITTGPPVHLRLDALGMVSSQVPDGPNKVFIGGLPYSLAEEEIKELLQAFGPLRGLHIVRDPLTQTSKGYAFAEWVDPANTEIAVAGLHGITLHEKTLTVRRAQSSSSSGGGMMMSSSTAGALDVQSLVAAATSGMGLPPPTDAGAAPPPPPPPPPPAGPPSNRICLRNMLTPDDIRDDAEYADVLADIRTELTQYGPVTALEVPRAGPDVCNVYVTFAGGEHADRAARALVARKFQGRQISVTFV